MEPGFQGFRICQKLFPLGIAGPERSQLSGSRIAPCGGITEQGGGVIAFRDRSRQPGSQLIDGGGEPLFLLQVRPQGSQAFAALQLLPLGSKGYPGLLPLPTAFSSRLPLEGEFSGKLEAIRLRGEDSLSGTDLANF